MKEEKAQISFYQWMEENEVSVKSYTDRDRDLANVSIDPLFTGTKRSTYHEFYCNNDIVCSRISYLLDYVDSIEGVDVRHTESMECIKKKFSIC